MTFKKSLLVLAVTSALISGCAKQSISTDASKNQQTLQAEQIKLASAQANQLFDTMFMAGVDRNPVRQTYLGIKKDYDKWYDYSQANLDKELAIAKTNLAQLQRINKDTLDTQTQLSLRLLIQRLENSIADDKWRFHNYPVNQMRGVHSQVPAFLINQHSISNVKEARDYISRVKGAEKLMVQLIEQLNRTKICLRTCDS